MPVFGTLRFPPGMLCAGFALLIVTLASTLGYSRGATTATASKRSIKPVDPSAVRKVHLVFSNHYDAGFADYASNILNRYLVGGPGTLGPPHPRNQTVYYNSFLLSAARTASALRAKNASRGAPRFRYMTHAYIASYFADCTTSYPHVKQGDPVRCPNASQLATFADAVAQGDIFWHAFPHNAEPELMDASFFEWSIDFARQLATRFNSPTTPQVLSQRDVPGLTRASIPSLAAQGVIGVSVGVNDGSPPPIVPSTTACYSGKRQVRTPFVWKDTGSGASVIADFHPGGYGGILPINPNEGVPYYSRDGVLCDCVGVNGLDEVLCYAWKGDNYGGANVSETEQNFDIFYQTFPNAEEVVASSLGEFWRLLDEHKGKMEVVTSEIGDTWIYGASSDPLKLATMRYMMRARHELENQIKSTDEKGIEGDNNALAEFHRLLLKLPEHTWGSCGSAHMHVTKPIDDWTADALENAIKRGEDPFYAVVQASWDEQRLFMTKARSSIPKTSPLGLLLDKEQALLSAAAPTPASLAMEGFEAQPQNRWSEIFMFPSAGIDVRFDIATGALISLTNHNSGTTWASSTPMFRFTYRSHSYAEAEAYAAIYKYSHGGKHPHIEPNGVPWPGMNNTYTIAKNWHAPITGVWLKENSIVIETTMPKDPMSIGYGPPTKIWFRYSFSVSCMVNLELVWEGKRPTRLRESIWLEMRPIFEPYLDWTLFIDKMGQKVNASDVVKLGGSVLHGMDPLGGVTFQGWPLRGCRNSTDACSSANQTSRSLVIKSLDCGLVAPGSNFNIWNITAYDNTHVNPKDGLAFDLYSNLYAVNYPMWYPWRSQDATTRFRFNILEF